MGVHKIRSHGSVVARKHMYDWLILLLLVVIEVVLNVIHPFYRFVGKDMMTDLRYPMKKNTVPVWAVPLYAVLLPIFVFLLYYLRKRCVYDLHHSIIGLLFAVLITGVLTDAIKDAVGRPRPDFFWRCFPDGVDKYDSFGDVLCHGNDKDIREGHKSFPSGHSSCKKCLASLCISFTQNYVRPKDEKDERLCINLSALILALPFSSPFGSICLVYTLFKVGFCTWISELFLWNGSFAGLSFLSLYLSGKIKAFDSRGHVAKLCIVFLPLLMAALVAVSRVDDYWHHWQDVFAGGLLGTVVAMFCYLQFFPPPYQTEGWGPYAYFQAQEESRANSELAHPGMEPVDTQDWNTNRFRPVSSLRNSSPTLDDMESGKI